MVIKGAARVERQACQLRRLATAASDTEMRDEFLLSARRLDAHAIEIDAFGDRARGRDADESERACARLPHPEKRVPRLHDKMRPAKVSVNGWRLPHAESADSIISR